MLILASSSPTRAKILKSAGFEFRQISFNYDESLINKNLPPNQYVQNIVRAKKQQFIKQNPNMTNLLFADSVVVCDGENLGKAKDEKDAQKLLKMQSQNIVRVVTGMLFLGEKIELSSVSFTEYEFGAFEQKDLQSYLESGEWCGKAGAMTVESFNKKYILSQKGNTSTAMGLNLEILKAFL